MKKTYFIIASCAILSLFSISSIAYSAEGPYVSGNLGIAIASDSDVTDSTAPNTTFELDSGLALGEALGSDFGNIRVEGEIPYHSTAPNTTFELDSGLALGAALGYDFGNIRVEGEIAYQKNDLDKSIQPGLASLNATGDYSSIALLLNGYYDFKNASAFTPFISGGIGGAKVELNDVNTLGSGLSNKNEDDTVFAYQVGAGVGYAVTEKVSLDVKYRYFATSDPEFGTTKVEYSSHNVYADIRVSF